MMRVAELVFCAVFFANVLESLAQFSTVVLGLVSWGLGATCELKFPKNRGTK